MASTSIEGRMGALLVQMNASWRLQRLGYHHVWKNKDMTNAFASVEWDLMGQAADKLFVEEDRKFADQRYKHATVSLPTSSGPLLVKTGTGGGLMGPPIQMGVGINPATHGFAPCITPECGLPASVPHSTNNQK